MSNLGVNIDHVATLRQTRGTKYPDVLEAATLVQLAGADQITVHLREDRRHIVDRDVHVLREFLQIPLNLEMGITDEMLEIACAVKPKMVTLVPEKREERTTEGGLAVASALDKVTKATRVLQNAGIEVSLFIEPDIREIDASVKSGATMVEIHTGAYADAAGEELEEEFEKIKKASHHVHDVGLILHAGHGLNYVNVRPIARLPHMCDLNIGHSIIARAVLVGLERAVREMKHLIQEK